MSDNEGMPDTPYREMSFLDEIIDYHKPGKKPVGGSLAVTWRVAIIAPFDIPARDDAVFADIGFWTALTNVHDVVLGTWLSSPVFPQLDPLPPGGFGEFQNGSVTIDVGLVAGFTGAGTFDISATATMGNGDVVPQTTGIAIVKFTGTVLLPLSNPGNVKGFVGTVIAADVATLDRGQSQSFACHASGDAYEFTDDPFPPRLGGSFALGIVGGFGSGGGGSFSLTHTTPFPGVV